MDLKRFEKRGPQGNIGPYQGNIESCMECTVGASRYGCFCMCGVLLTGFQVPFGLMQRFELIGIIVRARYGCFYTLRSVLKRVQFPLGLI